MKKILLSGSVIVAVAAVVVGATTAFYSDTETSSGNVLAAGAIDLGVDNESYYNGVFNPGTSWQLDYDIEDEGDEDNPLTRLFFNFDDLKPGDWGEDTISLHVRNNESWLCVDVQLTKNDDVSSTEPELDVDVLEDNSNDWDGELAQNIKWYWWADDGDNVFELCDSDQTDCKDEVLIHDGVSFPSSNQVHHVTLADSNRNIWTGSQNDPLPQNDSVRYIAKAWCFGDAVRLAHRQDGLGAGHPNGPDVRKIECDGSQMGNETQTDALMMNLTFRAVQARHNEGFVCQQPRPTATP